MRPRAATKLIRLSSCVIAESSTALFARLLSLASRSIARRLLRAREALMFLPAFGTFPSVVSAFVMSHKPDLRPLLEQEQSKRLRQADMPVKPPTTRVEGGGRQQNLADSLLAPSCLSYGANHLHARRLLLPGSHTGYGD